MQSAHTDLPRRRALVRVLSLTSFIALAAHMRFAHGQNVVRPDSRWYEAALSMRRLAESWGDQPYGAVVVLDDRLVGEGPSRVVQLGDDTAHAEREAIRDAQRRLGRNSLVGSVLYSTSRPCPACEAAAAAAGVSRMFYGEALRDAGQPGK